MIHKQLHKYAQLDRLKSRNSGFNLKSYLCTLLSNIIYLTCIRKYSKIGLSLEHQSLIIISFNCTLSGINIFFTPFIYIKRNLWLSKSLYTRRRRALSLPLFEEPLSFSALRQQGPPLTSRSTKRTKT